mgnify:CR=1
IGYPAKIKLIQKSFDLLGVHSETIEAVVASIAPIPIPLKNLSTIKWYIFFENPVKNTPDEIIITLIKI